MFYTEPLGVYGRTLNGVFVDVYNRGQVVTDNRQEIRVNVSDVAMKSRVRLIIFVACFINYSRKKENRY